MHGNVQYKVEHIFVWFYAGYGINVTGVNSREIILLFSMCRHAHSCAFISVIELPRIPAYCPKSGFQVPALPEAASPLRQLLHCF